MSMPRIVFQGFLRSILAAAVVLALAPAGEAANKQSSATARTALDPVLWKSLEWREVPTHE